MKWLFKILSDGEFNQCQTYYYTLKGISRFENNVLQYYTLEDDIQSAGVYVRTEYTGGQSGDGRSSKHFFEKDGIEYGIEPDYHGKLYFFDEDTKTESPVVKLSAFQETQPRFVQLLAVQGIQSPTILPLVVQETYHDVHKSAWDVIEKNSRRLKELKSNYL